MKKHIIYFFCLINISICTFGQSSLFVPTELDNYYYLPQNQSLPSPQISDFIKYGNLDVSHYNGLLNLKIELDKYSDMDFEIPISIKYISKGFIPSKRPSTVGLNWTLSAGGAITRTVCGSPDDTKGYYTDEDFKKYLKDGMLVSIRNNKIYTASQLWNYSVDHNTYQENTPFYMDSKYDLEPDIFNFSFGEYSGSFIIGNNGTPILLSERNCKIDISKLSIQSYSETETPVQSIITITTPDGYKYQFGGEKNYLEYCLPNNPKDCIVKPRTISSWLLKNITAPNGRKVEFHYSTSEQILKYSYFTCYTIEGGIQYLNNSSTPITPISSKDYKHFILRDRVYAPIINEIIIDGGASISFEYENSNISFNESGDYIMNLHSITTRYNRQPIRQSTFTYSSSGVYTFLSSVKKSGQSPYRFFYNLNPRLPDPSTYHVDHWGFWNGGYETTVTNVENYCFSVNTYKNCNSSLCDVSLLNKIIYPTGGFSKIYYEANSYRNYWEKDINEIKINLKEEDSNKIAGGARVKTIEDYTDNNTKRSKKYEYNKSINYSSGSINLKPEYRIDETTKTYGSTMILGPNNILIPVNILTQLLYIHISTNNLGFSEPTMEETIGYSDVREFFDDGSSILYQYSSFNSIPDVIDMNYQIGKMPHFETSLNNYQILKKHGLYRLNSMSRFRGKLLNKTFYSTTNGVKQKELYTYNINQAKNSYEVSLRTAPRGYQSNKIYTVPCLLIKKETRDYNNIFQMENYEYNNFDLINKKSTINSDFSEQAIIFHYATEISTPNAILQKMIDLNIINQPIEVIKTTKRNNVIYYTDIINYNYQNIYGYPQKESLYRLETTKPITNYSGSTDSRLHLYESYINYPNGKVKQCIKSNTESYVYVCGYNNLYTLAIIKNSNLQAVESVIGSLNQFASGTPDYSKIDLLRTQLKNAEVISYQYNPLIGITLKTAPNGIRTHYSYDATNRLEYIRDHNNNIIKQYIYHYKP